MFSSLSLVMDVQKLRDDKWLAFVRFSKRNMSPLAFLCARLINLWVFWRKAVI